VKVKSSVRIDAMSLTAVFYLVSGFLCPVALGQEQDNSHSRTSGASTQEIRSFSAEQELADLLDFMAAATETPIEFNRSEVTGSIGMRVPQPMTIDTLRELASRALAARGLTTVAMPGSSSLTVVKLAEAPSLARLEGGMLRDAKAGYVKKLLELSHDRTEPTLEAIKLVLSKSGTATAFKDTRKILVTDFYPNVQQAERVVARLDGDFVEMDAVEITLEHASPNELVALIERITNTKKTVFGEKPQGTLLAHPEGKSVLVIAPAIEMDVWRDLVHRFDRVEPTQTLNYFPRRFGVKETASLVEQVVPVGSDRQGWRVVSDELTGALVITATPAQHQVIQDLFSRLESTSEGPRRPIRTFPIKNRGVEELRDLLQGMLDKGALAGLPEVQKSPTGEVIDRKPLEPTPATTSAPTATPPPVAQGPTGPMPASKPSSTSTKGLGDEVILTADKATNRLIAMGNARVLEQLATLIAELDVRHPQVLVEALVVILTDDQTRSLGVEMQKMGIDNGVQWKLASLFGLGSPDPTSFGLPPLGGTGASGVILDPGSFSAAVRALETINKGRSLTIPKVLVNNNQQATLDSVLQTPFASTNASTTVATTSFGGTLDAGTQISVTPQITEGDQLLLEYSISLSAFAGPPSSPNLPPPRQENKLQSTVSVPDGYTVVVGGLEIQGESKSVSAVPFLGDIPLLGALFSNQTKSRTRDRFFVFLRTSVMRSSTFDDLRYATTPELAAAKLRDGCPTLEPRMIR
jgi:general secretion pathway protein D